jgi:hypothetical protein
LRYSIREYLDRRDVTEQVLSTILGFDETESTHVPEACRTLQSPLTNTATAPLAARTAASAAAAATTAWEAVSATSFFLSSYGRFLLPSNIPNLLSILYLKFELLVLLFLHPSFCFTLLVFRL